MRKNPVKLLVKDIAWGNVEAFFPLDYTEIEFEKFVEKAHPNERHARRVFPTIADDAQRKALEDAVNIVSQVVTPLWRQSKG